MGRIAPRRNLGDDALGNAGETDGVALLDREICESCGDAFCVLDFLYAGGAERHRTACVDDETKPQVRIGFGFLNIVAIRAAKRPPIEPAKIIARHVLAVLSEFDARAAMRAGMPARYTALHGPTRQQWQPGQAR